MSTRIDRVHFEERQYLRSYDWTAEQLYHIEMRRRLNLALHLWGIVDGLDVVEAPAVPSLPKRFLITVGMAIDGFGREILLGQDYVLTEDDLRRNRIQVLGRYWLSIAYRRELTTPPAPGYRLCDQKDQYTRWRESFQVLITPDDPTPTGGPPLVADPLSDDPVADPWPVVLGKLDVDASLAITGAWAEKRTYVGVRAQRVRAPVASLASTTPDSKLPIRVEADLLAEKNVAIGEDFIVAKTDVIPPPTAPTFPTGSGNLKVGTDLFLRGDLYKYVSATNKWLALKEYVSQFVPDVQVQSIPVPIVANSATTAPSSDVVPVSMTTRLTSPSKVDVAVSLHGIEWVSTEQKLQWWSDVIGDATARTVLQTIVVALERDVNGVPIATRTAVAQGVRHDFQVRWTIGPTMPTVPRLQVSKLHVACVGVFLP